MSTHDRHEPRCGVWVRCEVLMMRARTSRARCLSSETGNCAASSAMGAFLHECAGGPAHEGFNGGLGLGLRLSQTSKANAEGAEERRERRETRIEMGVDVLNREGNGNRKDAPSTPDRPSAKELERSTRCGSRAAQRGGLA